MEWTREYCNIQHCPLGRYDNGATWVTVQRFETGAELREWFPGCGLSPDITWYESVDAAKTAGEMLVGKHG
uniref:Uncharacterized protein n=1 Tax=viral metagenome TaxID=1070528 RepID=A0A6H1ZSS4_9ZZZZ